MKNLIFVLFLIFFYSLQSQESFSKIYGLEIEFLGTTFNDLLIENDTLFLYGAANPTSPSLNFGAFFVKMDTFGTILDYKYYPNPDNGIFSIGFLRGDIKSASDGGFVFLGHELTSGMGNLTKLNNKGELEFHKKYDPAPDSFIEVGVVEKVADGYLIGGYKSITGPSFNIDMVLLKTDKSGNLLWEKTYGQPQYIESLLSIYVENDNHIVLGGGQGTDLTNTPFQPNTFFRGYMIHIDSLGNVIQEVKSPDNQTAGLYNLTRMPDGWLFGTATTSLISPFTMGGKLRIARTGEDINDVKWELEFPNSLNNFADVVLAIEPTPDGHFVALADYRVLPYGSPVSTMKFTANGEMIWFRTDTVFTHPATGRTDNNPGGMVVSPSGSIYVAAYANSQGYDPVRSYAWLLKITPDGCIDTLCAMTTVIPELYDEALNDIVVYPNPTHAHIQLEYNKDFDASKIRQVEIWNSIGKRVLIWSDINKKSSFDISAFPSGLYQLLLRDKKGHVVFAKNIVKI